MANIISVFGNNIYPYSVITWVNLITYIYVLICIIITFLIHYFLLKFISKLKLEKIKKVN